jgi:hypothetical protein
MSNPNARGKLGNKGGGRLGYTYERDQLMRLRKIADRGIALVEAIMKGKVTDAEVTKYQRIEKAFLKALDKLQANKNDHTTQGEKLNPIPIYGGLSGHNSDQKDISTEEEN